MMIFGQSRYLDYEVSPGCADCGPVFPEGCNLLRLIDSQCSFNEIATAPGVYNWAALDRHLDSCEARGIEVCYCFCYTPEWAYRQDYVPEYPDYPGIASPHSHYPPRLDVFEQFFRDLIAHVTRPDGSSRIQYWEAWNESNALGYWCGTDAILLEQQKMLWRVIEELAPTTLLTMPTPTRNETSADECIDSYLAQGFQQYAHIVTFHGYCEQGSPGGAIRPTLEAINAVMAKHGCRHPVWDTEFNQNQGYPDDGQILADQVPQWIKDALVARLENNIACSIWWQWDNPNRCGTMCTWKGEINAAGEAWRNLYDSIHPLPPVTDLRQVAGRRREVTLLGEMDNNPEPLK